jgi:hypothetical protein
MNSSFKQYKREEIMGALIQTKGTQRLAKLFNDRFDAGSMNPTRGVASTSRTLRAAFSDGSLDLLTISDLFIAQNAVATTWPADGNDLLYPSATMSTTNPTGGAATNTLNFALGGLTAIPSIIAAGAAVCSLDARKTIPKGTVVGAVSAIAGGNFNITLVDKNAAAVNVTVTNLERISFAKGNHQQLVRRWRWYLRFDLAPENHVAIRRAVSSALEDSDFKKITFQTVEDTQRVLAQPERQLNNNLEFDDAFIMHIILMTQQTTAPDPLDPQ